MQNKNKCKKLKFIKKKNLPSTLEKLYRRSGCTGCRPPRARGKRTHTHTHTPVCCCESMNLMMLPSAAKTREDSSSLDGSSKPPKSVRGGRFHRSIHSTRPLDAAEMPRGHEIFACGPPNRFQLEAEKRLRCRIYGHQTTGRRSLDASSTSRTSRTRSTEPESATNSHAGNRF